MKRDSKRACRNLYRFIRLRLGDEISDREIARRWGMEWRSYSDLKHGRRRMPRVEDLEILARLLRVDAAFVFEAARGVSAKKINRLLEGNDRDGLARLLMAGIHATHAKAETAREHFRAILDRVGDAVFTVDLKGRFHDVNRCLCALTGFSEEELLERSVFDLVDLEETPKLMEAVAKVMSHGQVHGVEHRIRSKNGSTLTLSLSGTCIRDERGKPIGVQGVAQNVTDRRQMEEALHEAEQQYQVLQERSFDCVYLHDFDGNFVDANNAALGLTGYERDEIPTLNFLSLLHAEQLPRARRVLAELRETGFQKSTCEFGIRCKDGNYVDVETIATVIVRLGEPRMVLGLARDITEKKRLKKEVAEEHARFRGVFDAIPAPCMLQAQDGTILLANRYLFELVGRTAAEVVGRKPYEFFAGESEADCPVWKCLASGELAHKLSQVIDEHGNERYVHRTARPIFGPDGGVQQVVQVVIDITDQVTTNGTSLGVAASDGQRADGGTDAPPDREKRAFVRVPLEMPVFCRSHERNYEAMTCNLGRGGLFVRASEVWPPGTEVEVELHLPHENGVVEARAVVVWANAEDLTLPVGMGLEFKTLSSRAREALVDLVVRGTHRCT